MTLARKGARRIVVDGTAYRWHAARRHLCCDYEGGTLGWVAEDAAHPGTTLVVETGRRARLSPRPTPADLILPREVATGIRTALARGWNPTVNGSPFKIDLPNSETDQGS
ncbi:hypothetical protein [Kitasatospora sp. CB01950]|uniref:hypothetical protein n=1 Tax=Kitasatospora sp. CB01950 TaxID=1703930 RepID=UPI00093A625E|nr:hypothetical protein [Kitasatospora sp. CB01950]OKI93440.1 hypothetical protein AMK19_33285 [Kitasatospora sp. CB01950]